MLLRRLFDPGIIQVDHQTYGYERGVSKQDLLRLSWSRLAVQIFDCLRDNSLGLFWDIVTDGK